MSALSIQAANHTTGLTGAEVKELEAKWGPNALPEKVCNTLRRSASDNSHPMLRSLQKRNKFLVFLSYFWGPMPIMIWYDCRATNLTTIIKLCSLQDCHYHRAGQIHCCGRRMGRLCCADGAAGTQCGCDPIPVLMLVAGSLCSSQTRPWDLWRRTTRAMPLTHSSGSWRRRATSAVTESEFCTEASPRCRLM